MAAITRTGAIVHFPRVDNFDQLPLERATQILYDELIPACEAKGVCLSREGNHSSENSPINIQAYNEKKDSCSLFDVKRIQKAFASIENIVKRATQYKTGSSNLKHQVEGHPSQSDYITNGDLIATMLLKGYEARFWLRTEPIDVNCMFKAKVI